jgi:hypothetical protein
VPVNVGRLTRRIPRQPEVVRRAVTRYEKLASYLLGVATIVILFRNL